MPLPTYLQTNPYLRDTYVQFSPAFFRKMIWSRTKPRLGAFGGI